MAGSPLQVAESLRGLDSELYEKMVDLRFAHINCQSQFGREMLRLKMEELKRHRTEIKKLILEKEAHGDPSS